MFDKKTLQDFESRWIRAVRVDFVEGGCAGTKIRVDENVSDLEWLERRDVSGSLAVYFSPEYRAKLENARITGVDGKWIFASPSVMNRCGCWTSFSFSEKKDEAQILREKLHAARQVLKK